jgi:hypothetical protein
LNAQEVNDVRKTEICTAEPLVPEPSAFQVEMANEKLKRHKSPSACQIPAALFKIGVEQFTLRTMNLLILFGIRRNCLRIGKSQSLYLPIRVIKHIVVIIEAYHLCQPHKNFIQHSAVKVN